MIKGTGIDIIEVARVARELEKGGEKFIKRVFSSDEIEYCQRRAHRAQHYAARFAAKEAAFKALGTGWQKGVTWQDVAVKNDELGKPVLELSGRASELAERMAVRELHLSMTHTAEYAAAVVILEA